MRKKLLLAGVTLLTLAISTGTAVEKPKSTEGQCGVCYANGYKICQYGGRPYVQKCALAPRHTLAGKLQ